MAKLFFRYGAMNCGKSALLLQAVHNYEEQNMKVLVFKPKIDSKGNDTIVSRIGLSRKVDHLIDKNENIFEYVEKHKKGISCIFVDEVQFLDKEQIDQLLFVVIKFDIPVICYGLRLDFRGEGFPGSTRLLEISHTIEEMKTICKCGKKAMYNARFVNGKFTKDGDQVAIDGENNITYESMCPHCFYKNV